MNTKIPTAEKFLTNQGVPIEHLQNLPWFDYGNILTWLEEYSNIKAKFHVEAALKEQKRVDYVRRIL